MNNLLPYIIAFLGVLAVGLVTMIFYLLIKQSTTKKDYTQQLEELIEDHDDSIGLDDGLVSKWNRHWQKILSESGIARYETTGNTAGMDMLILSIASFLVALLVSRNFFFGLVIPVGLLYAVSLVVSSTAQKKTKQIDDQLPGLLFAIKSNLQSGQTSESALLSVIPAMPSPLLEDLSVARNTILANGTFKEALERLSHETTSKDLKFLCACMIQASISGSSMIMQIDNIQKVLEERRKVASEIDTSVKAVSPALWLAGLVIPVMFFVSYFLDSSAQDFWFKTGLSWIGFFGIVGLYVAGLIMTKNQVNKVRNI